MPIDTDTRALAILHEWVKTTGAEMNEARLRMTRIPKGADLILIKLLIAISESRKPRQNSPRYPVNAGLSLLELLTSALVAQITTDDQIRAVQHVPAQNQSATIVPVHADLNSICSGAMQPAVGRFSPRGAGNGESALAAE